MYSVVLGVGILLVAALFASFSHGRHNNLKPQEQ